MNQGSALHARMIDALGVPGLKIPYANVRLFRTDETLPAGAATPQAEDETVTCCQALRHAWNGETVLLTRDNIGCVAAAITLGLVDHQQEEPLPGPRTYTCLMQAQCGEPGFVPPSPAQFSRGEVYAHRQAGRPDFGLFGPDDTGRFQDLETARRALGAMAAIQPPIIKGVLFYTDAPELDDIRPDVVVLSLRPVELCRLLQGHAFITGQPIHAVMNPLRAVDSDLIARPYLSAQINVSAYCLGARLISGYEPDRMGLGAPLGAFERIVQGLEASAGGYPFARYPGSRP